MPELSEVEVARTRVHTWWCGRAASEVRVDDPKVLVNEEGLEAEALLTSPVTDVRRRGKYLLVDFGDRGHAVFHFRMTGKITRSPSPSRRFTRLAWLLDEVGWLVFDDARRLGGVTLMSREPLTHHPPLKAMGPEPHDLRDGAHLRERLGGTRRRLKDALLDQRVIAGVGNIAISELFFRVGLHPEQRAHTASMAHLNALVSQMPAYFDWLVRDQMADEIVYLNEGAGSQNPFAMYARQGEPCPECGAPIERLVATGRSTYYCGVCQPA